MQQGEETPPELAVRMVLEARDRAPALTLDEASARVARVLGLDSGEVRALVLEQHPDGAAPVPAAAAAAEGVQKAATASTRRRRRVAQVILGALGGLIVACLVWTVVACVLDVTTKRALQENGVTATATVTATEAGYCGGRGGCVPSRIDYRFRTGSGATVTATDVEVGGGTFDRLHVGGTVQVRYESGDPSRNQPVSELTSLSSATRALIVWPVAVVLFLLLLRAVRRIPALSRRTAPPRAGARRRPASVILGVVGLLAAFAACVGVATLIMLGVQAVLL